MESVNWDSVLPPTVYTYLDVRRCTGTCVRTCAAAVFRKWLFSGTAQILLVCVTDIL